MTKLIQQDPQHLTLYDLDYHTDPNMLPKRHQLKKFDVYFGQQRAQEAICTALDIKQPGYHIFASGRLGLGKKTLILELLTQHAKYQPTPDDWVYVYNFKDANRPLALNFEAGTGLKFAQTVHEIFKKAKKKLRIKFSSPTYQRKIDRLKLDFSDTQSKFYERLDNDAKNHHLTLIINNDGQADFIPSRTADKPLDTTVKNQLLKQYYDIEYQLNGLEKTLYQQLDALYHDAACAIIKPLFAVLLDTFTKPKVHQYLINLQDDMIKNASFITEEANGFFGNFQNPIPARYFVNVLSHHSKQTGCPVIFAESQSSSYAKLFGSIQYTTEQGTTYCDHSMIQSGLLHQANGGYLVLNAQTLFEYPYVWQGLKNALQSQKITLCNLDELFTTSTNLSLTPDDISLDVKVILLGTLDLYYDLTENDPDFERLFKIRADFDDKIVKNAESTLFLAQKITKTVKENKLLPFDNTAIAAILDELCRLSENKNLFDFHKDTLNNLLFESAYIAQKVQSPLVLKAHVKTALQNLEKRHSHISSLYWQEIKNGHQLFSMSGSAIGQINALTILDFGHNDNDKDAFGLPCKITALIQPNFGAGDVLDIERDIELAGNIHAKGMLIMASFLRSLFGEFGELNFSASLAMEQNYTYVDGDSATLAQMCVLFSALAQVPIQQNLAITGSMNQLGFAQAVGGVSQKVTGFFNACQIDGLTGNQGVILPKSNVQNLLLSDEILEAIDNKQFHIYAISHVFEALALLTGQSVCDKNKRGDYKKDSLFGKIIGRFTLWEKSFNKKS
ncbi:MAG: Lon protease family protein [Moraxella sp.]